MKKNYVIVNSETNGFFDKDDNTGLIMIDAIKVDENFNEIERFKEYIKPREELTKECEKLTGIKNRDLLNCRSEREVIIDFREFCQDSKVITHNARFFLSFLLKALYKNGIIDDFKFKYLDMKDLYKSYKNKIHNLKLESIKSYYKISAENDLESILIILKNYLQENNIENLNELFFKNPLNGWPFRGLNYPKYLLDFEKENRKYHGYVIDFSKDKYVSYFAHLKELRKEDFTFEELERLKQCGGIFIFNVCYLDDVSINFADIFSVQAFDETKVTKDCHKLINGINNYVLYRKDYKNLKLLLWGTISLLRQKYKVINKDILDELISLINIIKEPWDYWTLDDLKLLGIILMNDNLNLEEIARIGYTDDLYEVYVVTDDEGNVPHFHYRKITNGNYEFETSIRLDKPEYFYHTGKENILNKKQIKELVKFLKSQAKSLVYNSNWDFIKAMWNVNNANVLVDEEQLMPDYENLK